MAEKVYTIIDEAGIHARPATILVNTATKFSSDVSLEYKGKTVNLKSIMGVMSLGVAKGAEVTVKATGSDEDAVIAQLTQTMKENHLISE
ncbi:phosphocarrier protein HPr [Neobacillus mesonae]|uniref:phosphocarrier protein HPr n=1 Tax=Neobacillus mesonae TaxID=1193713 RepID=UPI00203F52F1|nr:phosphocarrier protein HPr [Neobacillus mesonae]MCM3570404.1 phosphocarrier protein HPr [Neobacillus mesonae]